jgi:hypothetical protein
MMMIPFNCSYRNKNDTMVLVQSHGCAEGEDGSKPRPLAFFFADELAPA